MKLFIASSAFLIFCACSSNSNLPKGYKTFVTAGNDTLVKDTLIKYSARPELGFNFDYLIYLPKGLKRNTSTYLLVETTNTGLNDSIEYHEKGARFAASKSSVGNYVSRKLKVPLLVPIFPRPSNQWQYYTHALDRETLLAREFGLERLDRQLLSMIHDAKSQLVQEGVPVKEKFLMVGFSASGTFANRFSMIYPEKIQATASGGINAIAILPISKLGGVTLNYPLGIADIKKVTGRRVKMRAFKELPKFLFMGELDVNDAVAFDDAYSKEERDIVYNMMGKELVPQRWDFIKAMYLKSGIAAEFRTYPKIGHGTDLKINNDLVVFFRKYTED